MDALVMAGGRGTRLDSSVEKPLYEIDGTPMLDRVCDALAASPVGHVYVATTDAAPATRQHAGARDDCVVVDTPGDGYVADLDAALSDPRLADPILTCVADLPLLAPAHISDVLEAVDARAGAALTVAVPVALKSLLGVSVDATLAGRELAPVGLNVVGSGPDEVLVTHDARLAVNVNREGDAAVARELGPRAES